MTAAAGPPCCVCGRAAGPDAMVWSDPGANPTVACRPCLVWLGETELELEGGR